MFSLYLPRCCNTHCNTPRDERALLGSYARSIAYIYLKIIIFGDHLNTILPGGYFISHVLAVTYGNNLPATNQSSLDHIIYTSTLSTKHITNSSSSTHELIFADAMLYVTFSRNSSEGPTARSILSSTANAMYWRTKTA